MDANLIGILLLLVGLELVLGVDNVLVISIFVGKLDEKVRNKARILGLAFALLARVIMLIVLVNLTKLTEAVILEFSVRDLILIAGGLFLIYKAVREIHGTVELKEEKEHLSGKKIQATLSMVISQIVLLDIVFSIDSVVTAIGMTDNLYIIILSVMLSFIGLLLYSRPVGEFIIRNPAIKILALAFLITIGVTIFIEGLHQDVPKAYIYLPMGFALIVEILQMRYEQNRKKLK